MSTINAQLLHRHGTNAERLAITLAAGRFFAVIDPGHTNDGKLYIGDGTTAGGRLVSGGDSPIALPATFTKLGRTYILDINADTGLPEWSIVT